MPIRRCELERAYTRYGPALVRKAQRMLGSEAEALDVVHELFVGFLECPPKSLDLPYLYVAVTRRCLNRIRDGKNRLRLLENHHHQGCRLGPGVPLDGRTVDRDLLFRLFQRLSVREVEVLTLCFMDGLRQEEAARALQVSRRTVVTRLARVRSAARALNKETEHAS